MFEDILKPCNKKCILDLKDTWVTCSGYSGNIKEGPARFGPCKFLDDNKNDNCSNPSGELYKRYPNPNTKI